MSYDAAFFGEQKIIVIGPQRSGTNIATAILAHETGLPSYSERDFGYSSCVLGDKPNNDLIQFIHGAEKYVLQAPALNAYCHLIHTDAIFAWVRRPADEVRRSRKRCGWPGELVEAAKYRKYHPNITFSDTVDAAIKAWEYQKHLINHIEIDYFSLSSSTLWRFERSSLGIGEI